MLRAPSDPLSESIVSHSYQDKRRLFARSKTDNSCYSAAVDVRLLSMSQSIDNNNLLFQEPLIGEPTSKSFDFSKR